MLMREKWQMIFLLLPFVADGVGKEVPILKGWH
jgi:hypothetical protein